MSCCGLNPRNHHLPPLNWSTSDAGLEETEAVHILGGKVPYMVNDYSIECKLKGYAAELHQRSSRISGDGNYISEPLLNCDALGQAEGLPLISWLYFNPFGPTACALFFTPVPGTEAGLLGFNMQNPFAREWAAFGIIPREVAAESLPMILASLFAANGHESCVLLGGLPTSIFHSDNWDLDGRLAPYINGDQARTLFRLAVQAINDVHLKSTSEYLRRYKDDPWSRAAAELDEGLLRAVVRVDDEQPGFNLRLWFDLVTDSAHVKSEHHNFGAA